MPRMSNPISYALTHPNWFNHTHMPINGKLSLFSLYRKHALWIQYSSYGITVRRTSHLMLEGHIETHHVILGNIIVLVMVGGKAQRVSCLLGFLGNWTARRPQINDLRAIRKLIRRAHFTYPEILCQVINPGHHHISTVHLCLQGAIATHNRGSWSTWVFFLPSLSCVPL